MDLYYPCLILFLAFIADMLIGDPPYKYHPVRIMGSSILFLIKGLEVRGIQGRITGVIIALIMIISFPAIYSVFHFILFKIHLSVSLFFDLFVCYSLLALKDLTDHINPVKSALESGDLPSARRAVGMVVGRDVSCLDERGVVRASIETVSENFVDGFISPVFWFLFGCFTGVFTGMEPLFTGICMLVVFKAASTLDSMVGYKTGEFEDTGWAGARLDDIMNFIPARLSIIIFSIGSFFCGLNLTDGIRVALRDRLKHDSPNSGHAESFVAGALRVRLGGPTLYPEGMKEKPWLGQEFPDPEPSHLEPAIRLIRYSAWITIIICLLLFGFIP